MFFLSMYLLFEDIEYAISVKWLGDPNHACSHWHCRHHHNVGSLLDTASWIIDLLLKLDDGSIVLIFRDDILCHFFSYSVVEIKNSFVSECPITIWLCSLRKPRVYISFNWTTKPMFTSISRMLTSLRHLGKLSSLAPIPMLFYFSFLIP